MYNCDTWCMKIRYRLLSQREPIFSRSKSYDLALTRDICIDVRNGFSSTTFGAILTQSRQYPRSFIASVSQFAALGDARTIDWRLPWFQKPFILTCAARARATIDWLSWRMAIVFHLLPSRTIGNMLPNEIDSRGTHGCFAAKPRKTILVSRLLWQVKALPEALCHFDYIRRGIRRQRKEIDRWVRESSFPTVKH